MPYMLDPPDCLFDDSPAFLQCKSLASMASSNNTMVGDKRGADERDTGDNNEGLDKRVC